MASDDVFMIQVSRPGTDGIGTPADYATMRSDIATALARPKITQLTDIADVDGPPADRHILLFDSNDGVWKSKYLDNEVMPQPYGILRSQDSANVSSTTDTSTMQPILTHTFTPSGAWMSWTVQVVGSALVSHSNAGNIVRVAVAINGLSGKIIGMGAPANPTRVSMPAVAVRSVLTANGDVTVTLGYRLNSSNGTAYAGGGILDIRLYPDIPVYP